MKALPSPYVRQILAGIAAVAVLAVGYYGTYLPLKKSQAFIDAMRAGGQYRSFGEFKEAFAAPLSVPSPVGQEELVRNTANAVANFISSLPEDEQGRALLEEMVEYVEENYAPIVERGRGMSFAQNFYLLGALNELALVKTRDVRYLAVAKQYFAAGLAMSPKRPQFLYGMFDIYRGEGDVEKVQEIANQILSQWPNDERTRSVLNEFLERAAAPAKGAAPAK